MSLAGKKIAITGAAGALGAGVAQVAHKQGAEVVLLDVVEGFTSELGQTHSVDLLDAQAVQSVFDVIGDFDVLANIAGGFDMGPQWMPPKTTFGNECSTLTSLHCGECWVQRCQL